MSESKDENVEIQAKCANCNLRKRSEENPKSLIARLWRWHTGWCPGWKAYQKELAALGKEPPKV